MSLSSFGKWPVEFLMIWHGFLKKTKQVAPDGVVSALVCGIFSAQPFAWLGITINSAVPAKRIKLGVKFGRNGSVAGVALLLRTGQWPEVTNYSFDNFTHGDILLQLKRAIAATAQRGVGFPATQF
ncbi:MAG: hypothetical protein ONB48_20095 [candidate division KSB1 bacterium]|nr:hypothetical protein [candidate division KSB1 bacterium]MDZ7276245.1 hypothetical protein [candidate division KSB1 bacterium]MDZ7287949.1 hypothetical protein [candidate division KSB1 bacterium]MDZ7300038.1 hypothetical protein [candidate division KSB1 bacterium]MDZ7308428.1 hypothetical protein [candidate division KSB1 bacterium]